MLAGIGKNHSDNNLNKKGPHGAELAPSQPPSWTSSRGLYDQTTSQG